MILIKPFISNKTINNVWKKKEEKSRFATSITSNTIQQNCGHTHTILPTLQNMAINIPMRSSGKMLIFFGGAGHYQCDMLRRSEIFPHRQNTFGARLPKTYYSDVYTFSLSLSLSLSLYPQFRCCGSRINRHRDYFSINGALTSGWIEWDGGGAGVDGGIRWTDQLTASAQPPIT